MSYTPDFFKPVLDKIKNEAIRNFTRYCLENAPIYFWSKPSSSSGKYHGGQNNGDGGLVRHSLTTAMFGLEFARMEKLSPDETDAVIAAAILHDLCKYGMPGGPHTTPDHCYTSAKYVNGLAGKFGAEVPLLKEILGGIAWHNGQWTKRTNGQTVKGYPEEYSKIEKIVHTADYAASRSFVSNTTLDVIGVG